MSQNENIPSFRNAIYGYNKDDINAYIREVNGSFVSATSDYEIRIKRLEKQLAESEREKAALGESLEKNNSKSKDDSASEHSAALEKQLSELCTRTAEIEKERDTALEKIRSLEERLEVLSSGAASEGDESIQRKVELFDKFSSQVGRIIIGAREEADAVVNSAKADAERIRSDAERAREKSKLELELQRGRAEEYLHSLCEAFACVSSDVSKKSGEKFGRMIESVCAELRTAAVRAGDEIAGMSERLGREYSSEIEASSRVLSERAVELGEERMRDSREDSKEASLKDSTPGSSGRLLPDDSITSDYGAAD